jgi:signal transduction histidine kinase
MATTRKPKLPNATRLARDFESKLAALRAEILSRDAFLFRVSLGLDQCVGALPKSPAASELASFAREFALVAREERPVPRARKLELSRVIPELVARWWPRLQAQLGDLPPPQLELAKGLRARVDPEHFETVFVELVSNACKYGGRGPIVIGLVATERHCVVSVADDGLPWAVHSGQRFLRGSVASRSPGFGLGLWLSRRLAIANGGRLSLRSLAIGGTRARVSLPRA